MKLEISILTIMCGMLQTGLFAQNSPMPGKTSYDTNLNLSNSNLNRSNFTYSGNSNAGFGGITNRFVNGTATNGFGSRSITNAFGYRGITNEFSGRGLTNDGIGYRYVYTNKVGTNGISTNPYSSHKNPYAVDPRAIGGIGTETNK